MAVQFQLPQGPSGKPIVVVARQDHRGVIANAGLRHELLELRLGNDIPLHGITELRCPVPSQRPWHMPFLIGCGIDIHLHQTDIRILTMLGHPGRAHQRFRMGIFCHVTTPSFVRNSIILGFQERAPNFYGTNPENERLRNAAF